MSEQIYPLALSAHACTNSLRGCSSVSHGCVGEHCAHSAVPCFTNFFHPVPFRSVPRFINDLAQCRRSLSEPYIVFIRAQAGLVVSEYFNRSSHFTMAKQFVFSFILFLALVFNIQGEPNIATFIYIFYA